LLGRPDEGVLAYAFLDALITPGFDLALVLFVVGILKRKAARNSRPPSATRGYLPLALL